MIRRLALVSSLAALVLGLSAGAAHAQPATPPVYQLRTYHTAPGKLPVLLERFETTNLPLFRKHGITLVGAWTPAAGDTAGDRLVYLVRFPDRDAADRNFRAFLDDPEWKRVYGAEKEAHGTVVSKADTVFLTPTDFSPLPAALPAATPDAVEELRIYHASPGKLDDLLKRFREHTLKLFETHGMTNVVYGVPAKGEAGEGATLVYFLSHKNRDTATASWKAFRDDPAWQAVYKASQPDGIPLAAKVESYFLTPTKFSPGR
jgi:hypothetical protein